MAGMSYTSGMYTQMRCCCCFSDSEDVDTLARYADVECRGPETSEANLDLESALMSR